MRCIVEPLVFMTSFAWLAIGQIRADAPNPIRTNNLHKSDVGLDRRSKGA